MSKLEKLKKEKKLIPRLKTWKVFLDKKKKIEKNKDRILRDIRQVFRLGKENKAIKDIILTNIRNLLENEQEEKFYKPVCVRNFWSNNNIEYEVIVIEIKHYQLKNILMKLDYI